MNREPPPDDCPLPEFHPWDCGCEWLGTDPDHDYDLAQEARDEC